MRRNYAYLPFPCLIPGRRDFYNTETNIQGKGVGVVKMHRQREGGEERGRGIMIDGSFMKVGRMIAMYTTAIAIMMYMALLSRISPTFFNLSFSATVHTSCP